MLTQPQQKLLDFIDSFLSRHGYCPSYGEMADAVGQKSRSGIHRMVLALERRGFIQRLPHQARAIRVVRNPGLRPAQEARRQRILAVVQAARDHSCTTGACVVCVAVAALMDGDEDGPF